MLSYVSFDNVLQYSNGKILFTDERVGNLCFVLKDSTKVASVMSQMQMIVRRTWSNPPNHGARIVATVLNNPPLYNNW